MQSFYEATVVRPERVRLSGKRAADVCIVGGGLAGLSTALGLGERGVRDVIVLEEAKREKARRELAAGGGA